MSQLEDLLQQCTIKLTLPGGGWGTGFFVAPEWILTCAHVVQKAEGQPVQVRWQNQENWAQAVVERSLPDPYDLALLRVTLPLNVNPPCVYLDAAILSRDPLYLFGYPDQDFPNGCPVTFSCEGLTGDEPALIKFALGQVRPGMSGAPLLNQRTGKVCGIVKFTRDRSFDLGGGAIPTRVILEQFPQLRELQREFHESDRRWLSLITTPTGIDFQPYLQAILANEDYREWQEVYTPTTVEDRQRMPAQGTTPVSQRRFSSRLKLRVETVKPDKKELENKPDRAPKPQERVEQWDVLAGLRNYAAEHVVLLGKPGSGKSTSLERLLWEEAEKALQDPNARISVLVKLRRCTGTIEGLIRDFLAGHQVALEIAKIEELLRQGRFLLLLDGLNELPKAFETEVANFRDRYRRTTPMIVSTRDLGGGSTLGIEKTLKMLPLTEPQMREFVRGYLAEEGDRLFQQLQGDRLRKFSETPLLLWMLCRVFAQSAQLPANLGLAFREFAQLHDQEIQEDAPADSKDQWHKLLRHLAFALMQGKTLTDLRLSMPREEAEDCLTVYLQQEGRANPRDCAERWLKDLLKYHLIQSVMQPNFEEHIEFHHQLIQEYYAAEYLLKLLPNLTNEQLKRDYLNYLKWTEPVALMLALVDDEAQALRVVKLAMDDVDLMLGARLIGKVKSKFQSRMVTFIEQLRVPQRLKITLLGMTATIASISYLEKALKTGNLSIRRRSIEALSKICSEATVPALTMALNDGDVRVRLEATRALADIQSTKAITTLMNMIRDDEPLVRDAAVIGLRQVNIDALIVHLQQALLSQQVNIRVQAIEVIEATRCEEAAIKLLLQAFRDANHEIGWKAAYVLAKVNGESAIKHLSEALNDENVEIRRRAAYSLGEIRGTNVVEPLSKAANDKDIEVRRQAIEALGKVGKVGGASIADPLILSLNDENLEIRRQALRALARNGNHSTVENIIPYLNDKNPEIRQEAAYALGELGDDSLTAALLQALDDEAPEVRRCLIEALGKIGNDTAIDALKIALRDGSLAVREEAAYALGIFGNKIEDYFSDDEDNLLESGGLERLDWNKNWNEEEFEGLEVEFKESKEAYEERVLNRIIDDELDTMINDEDLEITYIPSKLWIDLHESNEPIKAEYFESLEDENELEDTGDDLATATDLEELANPRALPFLSECLFIEGAEDVMAATLATQANCKYYNYKIWCEAIQNEELNMQNEEQEAAIKQTTNIFNIETLHAPHAALNLGGTIRGD